MTAPHFPLLVPDAQPEGLDVEVLSPFDRSVIATVARGGRGAVEQALKTAHALSRDRDGWLSPARRIEILARAALLMQQEREVLAVEAAREGGKPLVDSLVEVDRAIDGVRICVERLRTQAGREIPMGINAASAGRLAFTRHEPIGVVVAFGAFNHPLNMIVHQVAPAVAAGCPTIVKPAKATPLSCFRFVGILREAGLPEEWCQAMVTADDGLARELACDRRVGFFGFIGSAGVGWMLRSHLAPGTRCVARARGRGAGRRRCRRRPRRGDAAVAQGRILSRRPGLRLRAAGLRRAGDRRSPGGKIGPAGRGA